MPEKLENSPKEEDEAEFSKLFWAARKEHARLKKAAIADAPAHKAAISFALDRGWEWAQNLLECSRLAFSEHPVEALERLRVCGQSTPERWHGLIHYIRGGALSVKGEYDEAIKAYRKVLDDPWFDKPGYVWHSLGFILSKKGEHDEAIKASRKALEDQFFDLQGFAWQSLGNSLLSKGDVDEAINAYRKALDDPNFYAPESTWYNLGIAFFRKNNYDEAINAYRKALDHRQLIKSSRILNDIGRAFFQKGEYDEAISWYRNALDEPNTDQPARLWVNLAEVLAKIGNQQESEKAFTEALRSADPQGDDHARARLGLEVLKSRIEPNSLSPDDRALAAKPPSIEETVQIEDAIIAAIREAGDTQYDKYLKERKDSERDNTLSILRGWSSAVTLLEGSARRWRGGGYFLKWRGYGIVIDPGFDFLRNFHDANYHGREINAVIVSHNHPDHNSDLKDIDDLRYELYKRLASTDESGSKPYLLLWDEDTARSTKFGSETPQHQHQPVVMTSGFPQPFNLIDHPTKIPVRVIPFKVNHGSDVPHAMGMVVVLLDIEGNPDLRIGYTADTRYYSTLQTHLKDCDVIIAHISQPSIEELLDATKQKAVHLGYRGTIKLLSECKPKLALIGEFWAGYTDLRISLVKGLRQRTGLKDVLPAGLGMHIKLPSLDIECTQCHRWVPFIEIKIAPPSDNFGRQAYLCSRCVIE